MHSKELASLITFHRKRAGLSQTELARHASVSRYVVQSLESATGNTTWKSLEAVLEVLNLHLEPKGPLVDEWRRKFEDES
ncbi:MAG: helix-turn-helix domain-containing protein [Verrucomicrobiae bacterium]|nr:helix-turn-helix domain-containing protein [Verrucomicrobiae bacterium]